MKTGVCFGMVAAGLAAACQAQWAVERLNDCAVTNDLGEIVVLHDGGGVWGNNPNYGHGVAFDGDTGTFTDLTINNGQGAWAGFELQEPKIITSVRFFGRENWRGRARGVVIQGANTRDFSDADTLWTIVAPDNWDPVSWREETFAGIPPKTYTYVRFYCPLPNSYGGNLAEVEFYGAGPQALSASAPTPPPAVTFSGCINWRMNLCWAGDPQSAFLYEIERRMAHEAQFAPLVYVVAAQGEQHHIDMSLMLYQDAEYRIRAFDDNDAATWDTLQGLARNAGTGQWIGTQGSWDNNGRVTGDKAFDGNVMTYFDGPTGDGCWTGLDFGSAKEVIGVRYVPRRNGDAGRICRGWFEVADDPDFTNPTRIHTVPNDSVPPLSAVTEVAAGVVTAARYARFCSREEGYGNVAEVEFVLAPGTRPPNGLSVAPSDLTNQYAVLTWRTADVAGLISSVLVYRATSPGGPYDLLTPEGLPPTQTTWTDTGITPSILHYYKVASLLEAAPDPIEARGDYVTYLPILRIERDWSDLSHLRPGMVTITTENGTYGGNGVENIFDGDLTSFADITARNPAIGVDLGRPHEVHFIRFAARAGQLGRLNGAELRGSNDPVHYTNSFTRLLTFAGALPEQHVLMQTVTQEAFRYIFIQRPDEGEFFGNLTDLELYGFDPDAVNSILHAPASINLSLEADGRVTLAWAPGAAQDFYRIQRCDDGATWADLGDTPAAAFTDPSPALHQHALYRVAAVSGAYPDEAFAFSDPYDMVAYAPGNGTGLRAHYYADFATAYNPAEALAAKTLEAAPDWALPGGVPILPGVPGTANNVRIVWNGRIIIPFTGDYTFRLTTDDGAALSIGGTPLINNWVHRAATTDAVTLRLAAGEHTIRMDYFDSGGDKAAKLEWGGAVAQMPIPAAQLIPLDLPPGEDVFVAAGDWQGRTFGTGRLGFHTLHPDGSLTLGHAGGDLSGTGENHHYAWQSIRGDFLFEAKVHLDILPGGNSGKALLMVRNDLPGGSPFLAAASITSATLGRFNVKQRLAPGINITDGTTWAGPDPSPNPFHLRVSRKKDTFTFAYRDAQGGGWVAYHTFEDTEKVFPHALYAGLSVCAPDGGTQAMFQTATFSEISLKSLNGTVLMVR
ncbi:MAG: discoidin domain-containing protein [Kiritimatiellaeota bacterium]|nr:discoidin domain-containing protein [Kiritimatiellota bacterium]